MPTLSEILGAVIIGLLIIMLGLGVVIHVKNGTINDLNMRLGGADAANVSCTNQVEKQNVAVKNLQLAEKAITDAAAKAQKQAAQRDSVLKRQVSTLQAAKLSGDACLAADALFNSYIGGK